jgi:hypothetical protein
VPSAVINAMLSFDPVPVLPTSPPVATRNNWSPGEAGQADPYVSVNLPLLSVVTALEVTLATEPLAP